MSTCKVLEEEIRKLEEERDSLYVSIQEKTKLIQEKKLVLDVCKMMNDQENAEKYSDILKSILG